MPGGGSPRDPTHVPPEPQHSVRWLQPESPPKVSGQPARSRDADTDAGYDYDAVGNLHSTLYRNGVAATYTFNPRNWLRCLTSVLGAVVVASFDYDGALAAPGQPWLAETRLSPTGQRRAMMETVGTATRTVAYGYDLLSRLTKEDIQAATASPTALVAYDGTGTGQGYDRVGNRRSRQVTGTLPGVSAYAGDTFSERDLLNPGAGYTYDLNGNTTREPGDTLYAYDAENRLVKVTKPDGTTITLAYDADGNRVKKVVDAPGTANDSTTLYLVDDRNPTGYAQVIEERNGAGATTVTYTYGLDLVSQRRGTKVDYYGYDGLGSVRYLTDEAGAVTDTYTYDAFGIQIASTGTTPNVNRYTGEQWDENLSLYYLRARYYQPQLGRFWTMDSYEGSQSDPLSLHKYLYCQANPVMMVDPSGHDGDMPSLMSTVTGISRLAGSYVMRMPAMTKAAFTGGGVAIGRFFNQFGPVIQGYARQVIELVPRVQPLEEPVLQGFSRRPDFLLRVGDAMRLLEGKYQLPRAGEALSRMGSQIQQFAQWAAQAPNREVVVWALKSPDKVAEAEQVVLQAAGNPQGVRFLYGVEGLFEYLSQWAGF
jgi:RHS repeat-associated protein